MSLTEKQKAYHLRKMRTHLERLDVNKDGTISRADYELMTERMTALGKLTEEQAKRVHSIFMRVADNMSLDKGVQLTAPWLTDYLLTTPPEMVEVRLKQSHIPLFEVIDTNADGHISVEEFRVYLQTIVPDMTQEEVEHAFSTIDTNKNGEICLEEFLAAAKDFFYGVEETEVSRVFMGKLLD